MWPSELGRRIFDHVLGICWVRGHSLNKNVGLGWLGLFLFGLSMQKHAESGGHYVKKSFRDPKRDELADICDCVPNQTSPEDKSLLPGQASIFPREFTFSFLKAILWF